MGKIRFCSSAGISQSPSFNPACCARQAVLAFAFSFLRVVAIGFPVRLLPAVRLYLAVRAGFHKHCFFEAVAHGESPRFLPSPVCLLLFSWSPVHLLLFPPPPDRPSPCGNTRVL